MQGDEAGDPQHQPQTAVNGQGEHGAPHIQQGIEQRPVDGDVYGAAQPFFHRFDPLGLNFRIGVQLGSQRVGGTVDVKLLPPADIFPAELLSQIQGGVGGAFPVIPNGGQFGDSLQPVADSGGFAFSKGAQAGEETRRAVQMQAILGHFLQPCFHAGQVVKGTGRKPVAVCGFHKVSSFRDQRAGRGQRAWWGAASKSAPFSASAMQARRRSSSSR